MTTNLAIDLLQHLSGAVNAKDAFLRLLDRCRETARADAAAVFRRHTHRPGYEVVLTLGKAVKKEHLFATTLEDGPVTQREINHEENGLFFQGTKSSVNLALDRKDDEISAIVHLEWSDPSVLALATLKEMREAFPYLSPFVEHLQKYDSRLTIAPVSPEFRPEELDAELDIPDPTALFRRLYGILSARVKMDGAAFGFSEEDGLVFDPDHHFGKIDALPGTLPKDKYAHVYEAIDGLRSVSAPKSLAVPISVLGQTFGAAVLFPPSKGFSPEQIADIERILQGASIFVQKSFLYRQTRRAGSPPLLLVGVPREIMELCESYSDAEAPVLVRGETGTGKESIARLVHMTGRRRQGPFLAFNCAELVDTLAESQLFGHVKGAFTGAVGEAAGIFEQAHNGTLFLDEIHLLTPALQAKFLRAIETGEIRPVGSSGPMRRPNVRIIVATNRDLAQFVTEGKFLHDLYMRLDVLEVSLPPLRQNRQMILRIGNTLVTELAARNRKKIDGLSPRAKQALFLYDYPGNIRELKNILEKAIVTSKTPVIDIDGLPKKLLGAKAPADGMPMSLFEPDYETYKNATERSYLLKLLESAGGNVAEAARMSGLHRTHIYNLMKKHDIQSKQFKV